MKFLPNTRYSKLFIPTQKESPADAEVVSHQLMVRAGMIRKLAAGIYSILPLGLRVLKKIEQIIREEMNGIGGQETFLPSIQPAELWQESGRWGFYGKELLRIKDRHGREFCYGPTHEEVITDIVRKEVKSYRQLPLILYQIQTKFRDEVRPRFGIMRGREFTMKDAYSFHADEESTQETYRHMMAAYGNVFRRCGLDFRRVEADSGAIGGSFSHEFVVLADSGEDAVGFCESCGYASNLEKTEIRAPERAADSQPPEPLREIETPGQKTVEEVAAFLKIPADRIVKTIIFETETELVAALVRGDREVNPVKLKNLLGCATLVPAAPKVIESHVEVPCGFAGPVGLGLKIYADREIPLMRNFVTGANKKDTHHTGVQPDRDITLEEVSDLRLAQEGDPCPKCAGGAIKIKRGIEVGHIFILGDKYSVALKAHFLDPQGKEQPMQMGCYGIGVGRTAAAAIEQNHDARGIIWPRAIAPFQAIIIPVNFAVPAIREAAETLHKALWEQGIDTLLDDRPDRVGVKFKDADLIGIPLQIIIGAKNLEQGKIEIKLRKTNESHLYDFSSVLEKIPGLLDAI
ncbi:MAG: proline--tRNA ligase [Nitrospinales bacterium]